MKIIRNDANYLVISLNKGRLTVRVLFSYLTPVASRDSDGNVYVTDQSYSVTTSGHINKFIDGFPVPVVMSQQYFNTIEEQVQL